MWGWVLGCVVVGIHLVHHTLRVPARCAGYAADPRLRLKAQTVCRGAPALRAVMHRTGYPNQTPTRNSRWTDSSMFRAEERDRSGPTATLPIPQRGVGEGSTHI